VIAEVASWVLLAGGSFFLLVGGIGLMRMPDFFTRLHAAGVTDTAGAGLMLFGLMLHAGFTLVTVKLLLALFFILFTTPTACHALAKAALQEGLRPGHDDTGSAGSGTSRSDAGKASSPSRGS
jgi:multicomponent Na+:H+ antiporter subunit G